MLMTFAWACAARIDSAQVLPNARTIAQYKRAVALIAAEHGFRLLAGQCYLLTACVMNDLGQAVDVPDQ
jgi:hypothetical protein